MKQVNVFLFGITRFLNWQELPLRPAKLKARAFDVAGTAVITELGRDCEEVAGVYITVPEFLLPALAVLHGFPATGVTWTPGKSTTGIDLLVPIPNELGRMKDMVPIKHWPTAPGQSHWGV